MSWTKQEEAYAIGRAYGYWGWEDNNPYSWIFQHSCWKAYGNGYVHGYAARLKDVEAGNREP